MNNSHGGRQTTADEHVIEVKEPILLPSLSEDMKAVLDLLEESAGATVPSSESLRRRANPASSLLVLTTIGNRMGRLQPHCIQPKNLINVVAPKEKMIRQCNSESTNNFSGSDLVKMMVLDGYFITEFLRQITGDVPSNDILSNNSYMHVSLLRDLLRLSYIVLEDLFAITNDVETTSLTILVIKFFDGIMERAVPFLESHPKLKGVHLIDLLRLCLITRDRQKNCPTEKSSSYELVDSASKLSQAGIAFEQRKANTFLEIKFDFKKGIMHVPKLRINDTLQCILHNIVSFEPCSVNGDKQFTAFAMFMGSLIDTADDTQLFVWQLHHV